MVEIGELTKLEEDFKKYNKLELISALAGLQLCPENHSQILRLETASRIACKSINDGNDNIESLNLSDILKNNLPSDGTIGKQEDPLEGLFTDNIMFPNSNYTVYAGLNHIEPLILKNLIHVIFSLKDEFPEKFMAFVYLSANCLLNIVNEIANRNGQYRYMDSHNRWQEDIIVPEIDKLHELSNSVIFTKKEIEDLTSSNYNFIMPFVLPIGHSNFEIEDPLKNPLFRSPLIKIDDKIIVALPGSIACTLRHFILIKSQQFGITDFLLQNLREKMWFDINEHLKMMSFKYIDLNLPSLEDDLPCKEGIFRIDSDKLAYVLFITDDLTNYTLDEPYGTWNSKIYSELASERCEFITKWLTEGNAPNCNEVLILVIFGQIGRYGSINLTKLLDYSRTILMTYEELEIVAKTRECAKTGECDSLTLWKFAGARDSTDYPIVAPFLDQYAFYVNNNHSFYVSDDAEASQLFITLEPDLGRSLRVNVTNQWDTHAALHVTKPNAKVIRLDENIPIYYYEISGERMIDGYHQPIWVGIEKELLKKRELRGVCWDITATVSYWLWQLIPDLKSHLEPLSLNPVHIVLNLKNHENWIMDDLNRIDETSSFDYEVNDFIINFEIPDAIILIALEANNEADRVIIDEILKAFGLLLENHGLPNNLNDLERQRILDLHAPFGMKKHLYMIDSTNRISLNPQYLPNLRKIQENDIEEELDGLVSKLGDKSPQIGEVLDKNSKVKLCGDIVDVYYEELKSILPKFNWKSLLEKLIGYNEAICNKRAIDVLNTAPIIECYLDIPSKVEKDMIDVSKIERTAVVTRALIEIISAEPPNGDLEVSVDTLDKILAMTYHVVNWAMISDDIHFDLYDIDLKILNSGRVGVDRKKRIDTWDPFIRSKTLENVEDKIDNFKSYYKPEYSTEEHLEDNLDPAFKAEFGLSLTQINEFNTVLINISFEQGSSVACLQMSELNHRIKKELGWTDEDFQRAIDIFSLKKREQWDVPPNGFEKADIWPWRYNRALSYLRRPLVIGPEPEDDPIIYWGPRHVDEAERNLVHLVMNGRYITDKNTPKEMAELVGSVINKRGKDFNNHVEEWFRENTSFEIDTEVPIAPGESLESNVNLGDIDVLAIDKENKRIFSVECKNIFYGRTPREIQNEIEKFLGEKEEDDSWVKKHLKRHEWLNENINIFSSVYGLESDSFQIFSIFVTVREIPTTYIRDMPLPFISFTQLKREGIGSLHGILGLE